MASNHHCWYSEPREGLDQEAWLEHRESMTYEHKDTPESFWERMRAIHGPDYAPPVREGIKYCSQECADEGECQCDDCPFDDEVLGSAYRDAKAQADFYKQHGDDVA